MNWLRLSILLWWFSSPDSRPRETGIAPRSASSRRQTLLAFLLLCLQLGNPNAAVADVPIYVDSLASGWADWSWGSTRNLSNTSPVHGGSASIAVTITSPWAALYLHTSSPPNVRENDHLSFWIHGGGASQKINVVANGGTGYAVTAQPNVWTQVSVPFSALGISGSLTDLYWQDTTGAPQPTFYLDDLVLVAGPPPVAQPGPDLSVNVAAARHAISDDIYGMNFADEALAAELRLPVRRRGGNSTTRYNWQNDMFNTGSDYFFENIPEDNANPAALPDGSAADRTVEQDRRTGARTLMTVPLIGWVAKRRLGNHPYDCGFKVSKYGAQQYTDPYDTDCGNGIKTNASAITGNDPVDTSVAIGPAFMTSWINHLTGKYGTASHGGVAYYALDNEPSLWSSTHRDIHPQPLTYDEIRDRGYQYGAAIKAADPTARILGPVEWGWCGYFYSAADPSGCTIGADYQAHGNTPFVAWYLQQMQAYEQQHAVRILDYFDLHYYPASSGVSLSPVGGVATQALRLRSTRSLWDPAYIEESWISDLAPGGIAVQMIPRMKAWVSANYPGTRLAISEYSWGGLESINGALAQADVLGIFGREGLDLATIWGPPTSGQPGAFAFRMYRNYDGAGSAFGETSVQATSADQGKLAIFAAQRSADNALTLMVVNKTSTDLISQITLAGFSPRATASVYRYSDAAPGTIERPADQALTASGFSATFPGNSINLFVIPQAGTASPPSPNYTALWWNSAESGWGINVNHQGDIVFATLFTYDLSGNPMWLVMSNGNRQSGETFSGALYRTTGPAFNANPFTPIDPLSNVTTVGTMTFTFSGDSAALSYSVNGITVNKNIQKQVYGARAAICQTTTADRSSLTNYQDLWWNAAESGWGVNVTHQGDVIFATLFDYAATGQGLWLVMSGGVRQGDGSYLGDLYQTTGPAFNANPFTPIDPSSNVRKVGTMRFSFSDGQTGTLNYSVNGASVTKAITRQVFSSPVPACH